MHLRSAQLNMGGPYDLPRSLYPLQRGYLDPSIRIDQQARNPRPGSGSVGAGAWMCRREYDAAGVDRGHIVFRFDQPSQDTVQVRVLGSSAETADAGVDSAPATLGLSGQFAGLDVVLATEAEAGHQLAQHLLRVRREHPGVRLPATGAVFEELVVATLEQKVTHRQARHSWRNLLWRHGEAPGQDARLPAPKWMRLPLTAAQLRGVPSWGWHQLWVQPPLSKTVLEIAHRASAVHRLAADTPTETSEVAQLAQRLQAINGVGQWTTAETLQRSHASADLPSVGDYHLAHFVGEALTGSRTDDAGMLKLLERYRPHRQQLIRLLKLSGFHHDRFGPKLLEEDHRER